ncbi:MAG: RNA-binding S4 domain-containing protein [Clostridiales bacterium]|nr:RNA-binding S4 domain-containing protein [Clostridiales bacterium]
MRLDKYLKVSRIIKRRSVANEACNQGRVTVNDKIAKPSAKVEIGDILAIKFGDRINRYEILHLSEHALKKDAQDMYRELLGE